jgi:hypothetical protein
MEHVPHRIRRVVEMLGLANVLGVEEATNGQGAT